MLKSLPVLCSTSASINAVNANYLCYQSTSNFPRWASRRKTSSFPFRVKAFPPKAISHFQTLSVQQSDPVQTEPRWMSTMDVKQYFPDGVCLGNIIKNQEERSAASKAIARGVAPPENRFKYLRDAAKATSGHRTRGRIRWSRSG